MNAEPENPASTHGTSTAVRVQTWVWAACAVVFMLAHAALVNHFVPAQAVFTDKPLQGIDYDLHIGQVFRVVEALDRWGKAWLYDTQLLAGQPEGTITDSGSKGWELWTFALFRLGVPRAIAFNAFVLTIMLAAPVLLFFAAWNFGFGRWGSLLTAVMASSLWFFDSHLHWVWFVGMISWAGASCLAMLTLSLFQRFLRMPAPELGVGCGLCLGTTLLVHPYTFFVLAPPMLALYLRAFRRCSRTTHGLIVGIGLLALTINAFWLHNAAMNWQYILNSAYYAQAHTKYLVCDYFEVLCNGADSGVIGTRAGFRILYLALGVAGLIVWKRKKDERWLPIAVGILALYIVAYFGAFIPGMQQTQPYRQITPAMLMTTLPASAFLQHLWQQRVLLLERPGTRLLLGTLLFALVQQLIATQILYFFPELVPYPELHPDGARSPLSGYGFVSHPDLPPDLTYNVPHDPTYIEFGIEPVIQWLQANTAKGDRVLIEGSVLGERTAWRTNLEVLGGFFERNVAHVDANYFREHQTYAASPAQLAHYLQTYAVQWVIANRPEFERASTLLQRATIEHERRIYRTLLPVNRVLQGGGTVRASENQIEVHGSNPTETLVLSYHWHEALRCTPICRVERAPIDIDRVGFVRIPAPHPADLLVWNSYQSR